ncbi:hypothetical protein MTP03_26070 [Tsukamurella sp. PLM1]|nr:hypothetical protein MTP03_26070 [Tsukamurella sp. PLM1]
MTGLYALHRVMYADDEAAYLARPGEYAEAVEARRRLAAAEEALDAQVSTLLRMGSAAARHAVETAIGLVERVPKVFGLVGENVISPKAAEAALCRARALGAEQVREYDTALHERLTRELEVVSLPALREAADAIVDRLDHEAAERRRKLAERDRRVTFRPDEDGMGAVFALLPAHDQRAVRAAGPHRDYGVRRRPAHRAAASCRWADAVVPRLWHAGLPVRDGGLQVPRGRLLRRAGRRRCRHPVRHPLPRRPQRAGRP